MPDDAQEVLKVPEGMKAPSMDFAKHVAGQTKTSTRLAMVALAMWRLLALRVLSPSAVTAMALAFSRLGAPTPVRSRPTRMVMMSMVARPRC